MGASLTVTLLSAATWMNTGLTSLLLFFRVAATNTSPSFMVSWYSESWLLRAIEISSMGSDQSVPSKRESISEP